MKIWTEFKLRLRFQTRMILLRGWNWRLKIDYLLLLTWKNVFGEKNIELSGSLRGFRIRLSSIVFLKSGIHLSLSLCLNMDRRFILSQPKLPTTLWTSFRIFLLLAFLFCRIYPWLKTIFLDWWMAEWILFSPCFPPWRKLLLMCFPLTTTVRLGHMILGRPFFISIGISSSKMFQRWWYNSYPRVGFSLVSTRIL